MDLKISVLTAAGVVIGGLLSLSIGKPKAYIKLCDLFMKIAGMITVLFFGYWSGMNANITDENKDLIAVLALVSVGITFIIPMIAALIALPLKKESD